MIRFLALVTLLVTLAAASAAPGDIASAQQAGQCPANLALALSAPPEGAANITATVIPEVPLATPGQGGAGTYFIAWVADLDVATALPAGQPVPTNNPSIVRGGRTQNFDHLGGGEHRVAAVLVGSDGIPCTPRVSASISFTLQPTVFGEAQHRVSTV